MSIRVLVNGAYGRMGMASVKAISEDPELTLVGQTGHQDNLEEAIRQSKAEVVVDFTNAASALKNIQTIIKAGVHPVVGTTGLLKAQIIELQKECERLKLGGIIAPNFSLGAVLMMKYSQEIVKYFPQVEIIELHHDKKLDSPSGTSIRTAELMMENRAPETKAPAEIKEIIPGVRGASHHQIPIHAIRLPGLIAHQEVIFGGLGETLKIRHDSYDRVAFMPGVCLSCKKVKQLQGLIYGLENIL
jgi:4-hydroxy-tetrahydrodipicolinate reductase